jgi:hypothetical protein
MHGKASSLGSIIRKEQVEAQVSLMNCIDIFRFMALKR